MKNCYKGLTRVEVEKSRELHGDNGLKKEKVKGVVGRFFENLGDPIIKILLFALATEVIFTLGRCNLYEVFGIIAAILIATTVSTLSEYGSEKAFEKISKQSENGSARVIREGEVISVPSSELVVGDVVLLSAGEMLQADIEISEGSIQVDQSALNGENLEVVKCSGRGGEWSLSNPHRVFRGSMVTSGEAVGRVMRVGKETYYGMVAKDVQAQTRISPLKLRLSKLAGQISRLGYVVAGLVGFTYIFNCLVVDNGFVMNEIVASLKKPRELFDVFIKALTLMITVIVVAVPEGLPMMITVVLSANMRKMVKDNVLVKKMVGIETAGSLNILFTDKTGTLTTGKLSVERIITDEGRYKSLNSLKVREKLYGILSLCAHFNTDAVIGKDGVVGGNATDRALLDFFKDRRPPKAMVEQYVPFCSDRKYSSVRLSDGMTVIKGAPEIILNSCRFSINEKGERVVSDLSFARAELDAALVRGERVIAVAAYEDGKGDNMTFVCLVVLKDKIRPGVKKAVESVCGAGIQVVMVTGDNKDTAVSIAEECGIYKKGLGQLALTSEELARLNDSEVKEILPRIRVLSRALPRDKTRLVRLSQELDMVVGMTGDGVNDAPSLKLADVGFAMGSGTDIAKGAGDIIILDDSFAAIEKAVLFGRTIFKSIRKFVTFQLIMNLAACGITLIGQILGIDSPITIIQMLWVNIIMDTLGGLAFAGEPPMGAYMKEKPKRRDEPILSGEMVKKILLNGSFTLLLLTLFLRLDFFKNAFVASGGHMTAFYAVFIFAGLFNSFAARCDGYRMFKGLFKNRLFIGIMLLISVVQIFIIYYGGELFRSTPLKASELFTVILTASGVLVFDFLRRIASALSKKA